jgi:hypothetical protein
MHDVTPCPSCEGRDLFQGPSFGARGGHGPDLLPGLSRLLKAARLVPVVCRDCGLARFFVDAEARARLVEAKKWKRVL